jgi:signal transduction histidine kinase
MASRVFLILFLGIVTSAGLALFAADLEQQRSDRHAREVRLADRIDDIKRAFDAAPPDIRPALLGPGPEAPHIIAPDVPRGALDVPLTDRLHQRAALAGAKAFEPGIVGCRPAPPAPPPPPLGTAPPADPKPPAPPLPASGAQPPAPDCRLVSLPLSNGETVLLRFPMGPHSPPFDRRSLRPIFLAVLAIAAALLAYLVARLATAPLRRLADAAAALGENLERSPLRIEGPLEVRRAAEAFNGMQAELRAQLEERTQMLAAITHDLQTPLTRQRLRLERIADPDLRDALLADQADMQDLIRDGLELARLSSDTEPMVDLDLDSLLQTLADDAAALENTVRIPTDTGLIVHTHPNALKRCLSNLLDNAFKYGDEVSVDVRSEPGAVVISVLDRGPGIPSDQLTAVLRPFHRLEPSRSRDTGGSGLGLTIAKAMADRCGASLTLSNRVDTGLCASVTIPAADNRHRAT